MMIKLKINRLNKIEQHIQNVGSISLDNLCEAFKVSKNTIRRDIAELELRGSIKKVYGGIVSTPRDGVEPFESREIKHQSEKKLIAEIASEIVEDGDVIFIDSGTTCMHLLPFLAKKNNLTIITANLNVIMTAVPYHNLTIISTGGVLYRDTNSFTGPNIIDFLKNFNISKAFLASTGVSLSRGVTNTSPLEHDIKRYLIEKSTTRVLLVDHTKFDIVSLMTYCKLENLDYFVTDKTPPQEYLTYFGLNNVKLLIPGKDYC